VTEAPEVTLGTGSTGSPNDSLAQVGNELDTTSDSTQLRLDELLKTKLHNKFHPISGSETGSEFDISTITNPDQVPGYESLMTHYSYDSL